MAHFKRHKPKRDQQTVLANLCRFCAERDPVSANSALRLPFHDRRRMPPKDTLWGI